MLPSRVAQLLLEMVPERPSAAFGGCDFLDLTRMRVLAI